jgi:putative nucleotidyltransferase with HDIG domain
MKHLVAVIDGNEAHRTAVAEALCSVYSVAIFGDSANAISAMMTRNPGVILVGQRVGTIGGANFIRELRRERALAQIPVIFIIDNEDIRVLDTVRDFGIKNYIVKPYRRSDLVSAISTNINAKVQRTWQTLPPAQRKALEGTISVFNSIAEDIAKNKTISYDAVDKSCLDVVEVINDSGVVQMTHSVKDHDNFTYVHSMRMAAFLALFGKAIGLPKDQQRVLASGGFLHDIGKMKISRALLNKEGRLTREEWDILHNHVAASQRLLVDSEMPKGVMTIITQHHERLDGTGYPRGLCGREMNQLARMAAVIDIFCALTDRCAYKRALSAEAALDVMADEMSSQIDMNLLVKFREILLDTAGFKELATANSFS